MTFYNNFIIWIYIRDESIIFHKLLRLYGHVLNKVLPQDIQCSIHFQHCSMALYVDVDACHLDEYTIYMNIRVYLYFNCFANSHSNEIRCSLFIRIMNGNASRRRLTENYRRCSMHILFLEASSLVLCYYFIKIANWNRDAFLKSITFCNLYIVGGTCVDNM